MAVKAPDDTVVHELLAICLAAATVDTESDKQRAGDIAVVWYVPSLAPVESFRSGAKQKIIDIFGPWKTWTVDLTTPQVGSQHQSSIGEAS